ncbi:MAG: CHASE3 domain-containing protein [Alphaproteobacteria bacterium]|nr:CHASE3 domain-containing protein [Alphaproteobacteria bacterium]MBU1515336.1 CHASE3 domain-containing protein [Alphaproteobacteria bacterium]MBU2095386.1 CHASE3 domain-containing protein [Alphaproteobacteria bacterium]MBU2152594.1 CHASE3 domain-containing protein [Alphaproteobacteria bacterium]MBU2365070.1 CHASE3 domain-containing protein [Alphaproteobacteria bacterium]
MGRVRNDKALIALLIGFAALAAAVLGTVWLSQRQEAAAGWVRHTLEVETSISDTVALVQEAETAVRGYLVTDGQPEFLTAQQKAVGRLGPQFDRLQHLLGDSPGQQARLVRLREQARVRLAVLDAAVLRRQQGETLGQINQGLAGGQNRMTEFRATAAQMRADEERLLEQRAEQVRIEGLRLRIALLVSAVAVVVLGAFAFRDARRRLRRALEAGDDLAEANVKLKAEAESREAAEAQVRQFQKMQAIGQLTGGIAHDFNNMLAIIIGSLDLAKRRLKTDIVRAESCIDSALEGASRAAQLTARLLAFSRLQPLEPQVLDINKLVGGMSELLRRTIGENLRVETVLAGGLWRTHADPAQLENAIVNLCVNARDAMPDGGKLTIETSNAHLDDAYAATHAEVAAGQYVMISVSDTGTGMPSEVVERAFEPFYTTKGVGRGTGLGLSQVHGFVKQSHGHVKIYSESGVGTTIKIYLPRKTGEIEAGDGQVRPVDELPHGSAEEIILVVEDDDRVRHLSVDALRELGYTVVQASDAAQALAVLTLQPRIDLLFTDVVMPGLDGRRLAEKARAERPDLKVLYTTGYTKNAIVHNGMLDAGVALIAKPFTIEQIALKVRQVLDAEG